MNSEEVLRHTLPQLLVKRAGMTPNAVALRHKQFGVWSEVTYGEYEVRVREVALGLHALGLQSGEKIAVIADNIPAWVYMELGAQALGAVSVGVYQSSVPSEVQFVLEYTDAVIVLAENEEQVDKLLEVRAALPKLRKVIYEDPRGMRRFKHDPLFLSLEELLTLGRAGDPALFEEALARGKPDDVAHFSLTSGTSGNPKAVMLSHKNLLYMGSALMEVDPLQPGDDYLSFLPMAWIGEQMMTVAVALASGVTVNFPEDAETAMHDLIEVGPHVMFSPPRVWEGLQSQIWLRIQESYALNRFAYKALLRGAMKAADYSLRGESPPLHLRFVRFLAYWGLSRPLRDQLGFLRLRRAYTGGAALGPDVFRFYHALGVNLKQIYGQTEIVGIAYLHRDGDVRFDTVGKPLPGTDVRITDDGEVLSRSPAVCHGYYKNPEATAELLEGGWLHSGDAGRLTEDGHLVVIDRMSDVMKTAAGHTFSPQFVENKLKFSPFIKEAVVLGHERDEVDALLNVDPMTVGQWAEKRGLGYTTYMDLASKPEVANLIESEVRAVNESLPVQERIRKFVLLYKLLDADDDELTRTGKVRRKIVSQRYAPLIDALYSDAGSVRVLAEFKYQDGQSARVETDVPIHRVHDAVPPEVALA